jgi:acetylglutamate kinase
VEDLALFKVAKPESVRPIAVVKVGGEVITKEPEVLTRSLRFLRDQGLQPVVVHGGGPQLNDELAKAGVEPQYIGGHRVTDAATMAVARRVFESANADLAAALRAGGLDAAPVLGGVFMAEVHDPQLGLVGQITAVRQEQVEAALAAGRVPVLTSLGLSGAGQTLNINADVAARELAIALKPMRVVYISAGGGWKEEGRVVSEVNMAADYEAWVARDYTGRQGTLLKLKEMKAIVDNLPPAASVTIASAAALASQLLPHRGPGSQIRRGVKLLRFDSVGAADGVRLRALLQAAGCRAGVALLESAGAGPGGDLASSPASHASHITRIIATEDYSAAAIVTQPRGGPVPLPPVLHTLALAPAAYWEGSERALWSQLDREFPAGLAWYAPAPAASPADAAAAVARDGPASVPLHFPALSSRRSSAAATAGVALSPAAGSAGAGAHAASPATLAAGPSVFYRAAAAASPSALELSAIAAGVARYAGLGAVPAVAAGATVRPVLPVPTSAPSAGPAKEGSPLRVGLLGARGYVGRELVRLIAGHPNLQITVASSRAFKGQDVLTALGVPDAAGAVVPGLTMSDVGPEQLR